MLGASQNILSALAMNYVVNNESALCRLIPLLQAVPCTGNQSSPSATEELM